jgi:dimethylargininase
MRVPLNRHFHRVLELRDDETVDGGDVLVTPDTIFIGLSQRTTRIGAEALSARLAEFGRAARIVETPKGILHFKTAVSLLDDNTIVATQRFAASAILPGFKLLTVPEGEDAAANLLRVNDKVLVGEAFPRTIALIEKHGFAVEALPVGEIGKLDAGLSCMSLRWRVA